MSTRIKRWLSTVANDLRVMFLIPLILLVWTTEVFDKRLWKHWDMKSLETWRRLAWRWWAYAMALTSWGITAGVVYWLTRWCVR